MFFVCDQPRHPLFLLRTGLHTRAINALFAFMTSAKEVEAKKRFEFINSNKEIYTIAEMCRILNVSRQGYYKYLNYLDKPYKYAQLLVMIRAILKEDEFNNSYGRKRLHSALLMKGIKVSLSTVYRVCKENNILQTKRKPKGFTKVDKEAYKNDDLLKGDFNSDTPNKKLIGDITQSGRKTKNVLLLDQAS